MKPLILGVMAGCLTLSLPAMAQAPPCTLLDGSPCPPVNTPNPGTAQTSLPILPPEVEGPLDYCFSAQARTGDYAGMGPTALADAERLIGKCDVTEFMSTCLSWPGYYEQRCMDVLLLTSIHVIRLNCRANGHFCGALD